MEKGLIAAPQLQEAAETSTSNTEDHGRPSRFKEGPDGVYCFSPKYEKYQYVGGPLKVLARSRDKLSEGWGLLVEFEDYDKQVKAWNIPGCFLVAEGGNKAVEGLIHRGYKLSPQREAKNQLREFLGGYETPERVRLVNRIGWYGEDAFMLPNQMIGKPKEPLHYYSDSADLCKIATSGELEDWTQNIGTYGNRNIFLTFALSTAFAGPFIDIKDTELFGVHLFGDSSLGKTTLLEMAASVYGNPEKGEYTKTWRTTSNALEGMAAAHSDCLLVLDEIGQIEPRIVGETVYSLCSGVGKSRANETGSNRGNQHRWRICFLSSGEKTLADHMAEANQKPKAGQEVRLLAVSPCPHKDEDKRRYLGNFNDDHGFGGGARLSQHLKEQARKYYGTPFLALLESIVNDNREDLAKYVSTIRSNFKFEALQTSASGQADRAADKFALIAAAGEYATKIGITGWQSGWATHAAHYCFKAWIAQRGGDGSLEDQQAIDQVRGLLLKYGESRFTRWEGDGAKVDEHAPRTMERWGYRKTTVETYSNDGESSETIFYIPAKSFDEICKGFDKSRVAELLDMRGALVEKDKPDRNGTQRKTKKTRLPGSGKKTLNCYVIGLAQLLDDNEPEAGNELEFNDIPGFD